MTRLVTTGWEAGDLSEPGGVYSGTATQSVVTSTPTPRSPGTYCYKIAGASDGARTWTFTVSKTEVWVRFSVYIHRVSTTVLEICGFYDSAGTLQGCVSWRSADQFLSVRQGAFTVLGTSTLALSADAWHTVEVRWQITSTSSGTVEVWVDGTRYLNLTSVDNTATANANVQRFALGYGLGVSSLGSGEYEAYDDLAINDTSGSINNGQIGDGRVVLLKPNGAGSNTAQTRGGTDSGANWSQVDEFPPSLTDYVFSATAGTRDTYALQDVPAGTWNVNCVEALVFAANSDTGAGSLGPTVKSGATTNEGTAQVLAMTAGYYRQLYETDPNTSSAWTVAAVNALEAGTTVR